MEKTIWDILDADFIKLVETSTNYSELMRKCGYRNTSNRSTITKRIKKLNLSTLHFKKTQTNLFKTIPLDQIFIENSTYNSNQLIKKKLLDHFKWEYKCNRCGINSWQGEKLSLELDHINGNNKDNRIENLRFQCYNCHSLTPTFRSKNKAKIPDLKCNDCDKILYKQNQSGYCNKCISKYKIAITKNKPTLKQIEEDLKELKSYVAVAKKYNVSDNCIRKWIKRYNQLSPKPIDQYILELMNIEI